MSGVLCGVLAACGGGGAVEESAVPDRQEACGEVLSSDVTAVVEEIAGDVETDFSGGMSSMEIAEKLTHEAYGPEEIYETGGYALCSVFALDNSSHPLLDIRYRTAYAYELASGEDLPEGSVVYSLGREAHGTSDSAFLYFDCVIPSADGRSTTVIASASRMGAHPEPGQEDAMMTVAHSAALAMAGEMGCEGNGGLAEEADLRPVGGDVS